MASINLNTVGKKALQETLVALGYVGREKGRDWDRVEAMTDAEFEEEIDYLCKRAGEEAAREDRFEAEALARWQARIAANAAAQSVDVATMVRWEMQAQDEEWVEHYVWDQGIGCGRHMTAAKEWLRGHGVERV